MIFVLVGLTAFLASLLKFFSGFGLATVLTPIFAIFFNIETSIAIVAVVHLLNNIFKLGLVGKLANKEVVFRFGLPAIVAAGIGAKLLESFALMNTPLLTYSVGTHEFQIMTVKLVVASLILFFTLFEALPLFQKLQYLTTICLSVVS